jgi:hypothetical protein
MTLLKLDVIYIERQDIADKMLKVALNTIERQERTVIKEIVRHILY